MSDPEPIRRAGSTGERAGSGDAELLAALREEIARLRAEHRAKDELLAAVSHELRNALNTMTGWVTLLKAGALEPSQREHALEVLERNVAAQTRLVNDLLHGAGGVSSRIVLDRDQVDLARLVEGEVSASLPAARAKNIQLFYEVDERLQPISGDGDRLRQVLSNVISNAIKFTPKGGQIRVYARCLGSEVEVGVSDDGVGIPEDFLPHVFEAFRQAAATRGRAAGIGLGLAIAKQLVELHGGRIMVESPGPGRGAHFRWCLPAEPGSRRQSTQSPGADDLGGKLHGLELLLIEDNEDARDMIQLLLEGCGAKVVALPDAAQALALLENTRFDLIVSDVGLPGMSGLELIRALRSRSSSASSRAPALALTGHAGAAERAAVLQAGFQAHVAKPVRNDELIDQILRLLGHRPSPPPADTSRSHP